MNLSNKITGCIWDGCAKQIVDGYVYVKMDDIIKIDINKEDLIMDDLEIIPEIVTKEIIVKEEINMDSVANYLTSKGFKYKKDAHRQNESWTKYSEY